MWLIGNKQEEKGTAISLPLECKPGKVGET